MEYISVRVSDIVRRINHDLFLPAIQREFVWEPARVERLFDSIMSDFPIGSFLYWQLEQAHKDDWPIYEFVRNFDAEDPHNELANMAGVTKDITLVLDGQQRITSLYVGLKGTYRYFHYRWRQTALYLNLLKVPKANDDNPEEATFGFLFRETDEPNDEQTELWYPVGKILDYEDAEDAKAAMKEQLSSLDEGLRENANKLIGRLHNRVHTTLVGNYYLEKSQDYDKVLQIFVRANSGGLPLEYSDLLLATATAKWESLDARKEIHEFTDLINDIGSGYKFDKDFVLKACLYLTESLPIQYKVKNFNKKNLREIESNWERIKNAIGTTVRLVSSFGFSAKNIVAPLALLPIAFYLMKRGNFNFDHSSNKDDTNQQISIRQWLIFATLKGAFGGSSDTTLTRLRDLLGQCASDAPFPSEQLYKSLSIEPQFSDEEIDRILSYRYQGRYTYLILSLIYPDRNWKDVVIHEDHIFPQSEFQVRPLRARGYDDAMIESYIAKFNLIGNLQLLTGSENLSKNSADFEDWIQTRETGFRSLHKIPTLSDYSFDTFETFFEERNKLIKTALKGI